MLLSSARQRLLMRNNSSLLRVQLLLCVPLLLTWSQSQYNTVHSFTIIARVRQMNSLARTSPPMITRNNLQKIKMEKKDLDESDLCSISKNEVQLPRWCTSALMVASIAFVSSFGCQVSAESSAVLSTQSVSALEKKVLLPSDSSTSPNDSQTISTGRGLASKYWTIQNDGTPEERYEANRALLDHIVGTVNTMYYDRSAGSQFTPSEYNSQFRSWLRNDPMAQYMLSTREGTVTALKSIFINQKSIPDPFAKYLTREELMAELKSNNDGFLGIGVIVEPPGSNPFMEDCEQKLRNDDTSEDKIDIPIKPKQQKWKVSESLSFIRYSSKNYHQSRSNNNAQNNFVVDSRMVCDLPVITAVVPFSPAERAGLTVGDRIIAVQDDSFLHLSRQQVTTKLKERYSADVNEYFGNPEITIAKAVIPTVDSTTSRYTVEKDTLSRSNLLVQSYRPIRVRLSTIATATVNPSASATISQERKQEEVSSLTPSSQVSNIANFQDSTFQVEKKVTAKGNNVVKWQLLSSADSIFIDTVPFASSLAERSKVESQQQSSVIQQLISTDGYIGVEDANDRTSQNSFRSTDTVTGGVGYIRLTRFSRSATEGFVQAVDQLEALGATSYIIDLRNNYGGVIQSAMMLASSLLRDSHDVICFTMNSRGGFTPHDVEEFVVDKNYPGYLLSSESADATINQIRVENPTYLENDGAGWSPPSAYASLHEQGIKRGIHKGRQKLTYMSNNIDSLSPAEKLRQQQMDAQKPIVLLVNEGTASSAEVFASALHDNGRVVALIGAKTYGKGLIQHTFPLPDGGGLRLTVAEYLTPALQHVSRIGGAQYDPRTGNWIGGGLRPDVYCDDKQGIPNNVGADFCVGTALDALEEFTQTGHLDLLDDNFEEIDKQ